MNWSDKARIIAQDIIRKQKGKGKSMEELLAMAAVEGMKYECDLWLHVSQEPRVKS